MRSLDKYRDIGLLILGAGIGIMFIGYGLPKLIAGPDKWVILGGTMEALGVDFAPKDLGLHGGIFRICRWHATGLGFFYSSGLLLFAYDYGHGNIHAHQQG